MVELKCKVNVPECSMIENGFEDPPAEHPASVRGERLRDIQGQGCEMSQPRRRGDEVEGRGFL